MTEKIARYLCAKDWKFMQHLTIVQSSNSNLQSIAYLILQILGMKSLLHNSNIREKLLMVSATVVSLVLLSVLARRLSIHLCVAIYVTIFCRSDVYLPYPYSLSQSCSVVASPYSNTDIVNYGKE